MSTPMSLRKWSWFITVLIILTLLVLVGKSPEWWLKVFSRNTGLTPFLISSLTATYVTRVLMFDIERSEPRLPVNYPVVFIGNERPFSLFDAIRWYFGLYYKNGSTMVVNPDLHGLWSCAWCLGFWVSLIISVVFGTTSYALACAAVVGVVLNER